jgi:L-lactate dehydrogenase complex protein LldE
MSVSLFVTCLVDQLWPSVGARAVQVLCRAGCEVEFDQRPIGVHGARRVARHSD